ncbi:MAG: alpha/beta fold hydrolase [Candidatus Lokiarchaeota archaeon]|nr:alpha/beta fold hydrolase [Candidatus Lokiarchaeota archaeon]
MPFADVNEIKMYYETHGEGYPVILHHGYGATNEIWVAQIGELSKEFKVITLDCRSSGKTTHPKEPYTLDTLVEDLKGLMEFLEIEEAHLVGQSMGGWIAQNFVLKYADYVNKLVLIGTNHKGSGIQFLTNTLAELYEEQKEDKESAYWKYAKLTHDRKVIKEMMADQSKKFHGIWNAELMIEEFTENNMTPEDYQLLADAIETHDVTDRLQEIKKPTLLIVGKKDKLSPKLVMEEIDNRLENSRLEVIGNAHHVFLEEAPQVNKAILGFLNS